MRRGAEDKAQAAGLPARGILAAYRDGGPGGEGAAGGHGIMALGMWGVRCLTTTRGDAEGASGWTGLEREMGSH